MEKFLKKTLYRKINVHMKMEKIKVCETISGLPVYAIYIHHKKNQKIDTSNINPSSPGRTSPQQIKQNKSVIFMARQHSG